MTALTMFAVQMDYVQMDAFEENGGISATSIAKKDV
jgi:hypothetical protein